MIHFSFSLTSNYTTIYQITQEGLLIAKTNKLKPSQKHVLEVSFPKSEQRQQRCEIKKKATVKCFCRSWLSIRNRVKPPSPLWWWKCWLKGNWVRRRPHIQNHGRFQLGVDELYVSVNCSSLQCTGRGAQDQLHFGESVVPLHGLPDYSWMYHFHGDVAEEEAPGKEGPAGEGLRGPGQTPKCGEKLISGIFSLCLC